MKIQTLLLLFGLTLKIYAQNQSSQGSSTVVISPYQVIERGPHHHLWQRVTAQTDGAGNILYQMTNTYQEIVTGLCFWNGTQWVDSSDQIQLTANGASATSTQHQVNFAANINTSGAINLTTPDGQQMTSQVLGLSYIDSSSGNNVLFAETQDSIGQLLLSGNQVIYTNAFSDVNCDVLYTHRLAGFEQDIVIRKQLPSPASYGLSGTNIWLQVWTEFTAAPAPQVTPQNNGDNFLDFGVMKMGRGKAFMLGSTSNAVPVVKQWVTSQGRTFLVESVQFNAIAGQLVQLPALSQSSGSSSSNSNYQARIRNSHPTLASLAPPPPNFKGLKLPSPKTAPKSSAAMSLARGNASLKGLVLDYTTVNGSLTDFTFQSDTTYYVTGEVDISGTNYIEGGTVIKFSATGTESIVPANVVWKTGMYRPAVFTGKDDDSVGQQISGSSGNPSGTYYGGIALNFNSSTTPDLCNARFSFLNAAVSANGMPFRNVQFVQCQSVIASGEGNNNLFMYNVLVWNVGYLAGTDGPGPMYPGQNILGENCTIDTCGSLYGDPTGAYIIWTNCILNSIGDPHLTYETTVANNTVNSDGSTFQTVGAGTHYLANATNGSVGTTNIDSTLLADLRQRTTYPPLVFVQSNYSINSTLFPQAQRDAGPNLNLGYHYDPIDYAFSSILVTNATLTVMPGTAIAGFGTNGGTYGLSICTGGQFLCQGTPDNLCRIVNFNTVQDQATSSWHASGLSLLGSDTLGYSPSSVINCRFTDFSIMAQDCTNVYANTGGNSQTPNFQDCQFHGGILFSHIGVNLTNCLLERVNSTLVTSGSTTGYLRNCLFWGGSLATGSGAFNGIIQDNMFDLAQISDSGGYTYGYNAFNSTNINANVLSLTNSTDLLTNVVYQTSWLGNYYQTNTSPLINKGSTTADQLGLFQYTTQTNQVKETNSQVDIGYHYVAVNSSTGIPDDTNGDGVPDYLEDANGDGLVSSGEINWMVPGDLGLNVVITRPSNNSVVP